MDGHRVRLQRARRSAAAPGHVHGDVQAVARSPPPSNRHAARSTPHVSDVGPRCWRPPEGRLRAARTRQHQHHARPLQPRHRGHAKLGRRADRRAPVRCVTPMIPLRVSPRRHRVAASATQLLPRPPMFGRLTRARRRRPQRLSKFSRQLARSSLHMGRYRVVDQRLLVFRPGVMCVASTTCRGPGRRTFGAPIPR